MNVDVYKKVLSLSLLLLTGTLAFGRTKHPAKGAFPKVEKTPGLDFIENKGQWVPEARFKAEVPGGVMFVTNRGFVYNYLSQEDIEHFHELTHERNVDLSKEMVHSHAYRVNFVGANPDISYKQEGKRKYYHNYFIGNDKSKWAGNVGLFGKVLQQNVYHGVDVAVYSKNNNLKYDFIVQPGADVTQIRLSFEGVKPELTKEGSLKVKTSVNEIVEQAPYTYQLINGKEVEVPSRYVLEKGQLSFAFPQGYNAQYPLVIDPTLVFATYSGGTGGGSGFYGFSTTYDSDGSAYAGTGAGGAGWPTNLGPSFQPAYSASGNFIVGVNKYNALGTALVYSTYYGGTTGPDFVHTMKVNDQGELIIAGSTQSSNLPVTTGCFDNSLGGLVDIFVAHFNSTGTALIGATYLGGSAEEPNTFSFTGLNSGFGNGGSNFSQHTTSPVEINTDPAGNIWVVSDTRSTDFPVSTNAQQATLAGGSSDGVVCKLNPDCSQLLYSSYLGGTGNDGILSTQFNPAGNLVVGGVTQSTDFPTTTGAYKTTAPSGGTSLDGFVTIINPNTGALLKSTYLGTANNDQVVAVQVDATGNVFAFGRTDGAYTVSPGVYSIPGSDVFIDRLSPDLSSSQLSTTIGLATTNFTHFFPDGFLVDVCGNAYVTGMQAASGLPTTADAASTNSNLPFWFCVLKPNFQDILYGSYFGAGGDHVHVGNNRLDPNGVVYHSICNNTQGGWGSPTLITPGAWSMTKQTTGQDIITFKFDFEATGVISNFALDTTISKKDTGCVPYTVKMVNKTNSPTAAAATTFKWDFGDGSPIVTSNAPTHTYTNTGTFTITLYAHNDSACIKDDTAYMHITVLKTELPVISVQDTTVCSYQQAINIGVTIHNPSPNNTIQWGPAGGLLTAPNLPTVSVDPTVSNRYWVVVKDTIPGICGFSTSDTVHIDLAPRVLDIITNDTVVCQGAAVPIVAVGSNGYTYNWSPATGVSDTTVLQPVITINQPNVYTLTASYPNCPDTSVIINFGMHYIPTLDLGPDKSACQWTDVTLESTVTPFRNDYIYQWVPATPDLSNPTGPNTHFTADTTITYTLQVKTPIGCADQDSITVVVFPGAFGAAASDTGYCPGNQARLWATGGVSYTWSPAYGLSDSTSATPVASPQTSTDYTVLIRDIHNCTDTEKVAVQVYAQAMLNLPDSVTVYPGEQYHVEPGTNCLYFSWFPPSGLNNPNIADPLMNPAVRTRYFVTGTTEHGCVVTDSMDVLVEETVIDMPNAFAPAGSNKVFKPSKRGIAQLKSFTVFNRWGNKVYSSTNIDEGWDGNYKGQPQPMGVYIYSIDAVTDKGVQFVKKGNVTLIR